MYCLMVTVCKVLEMPLVELLCDEENIVVQSIRTV